MGLEIPVDQPERIHEVSQVLWGKDETRWRVISFINLELTWHRLGWVHIGFQAPCDIPESLTQSLFVFHQG